MAIQKHRGRYFILHDPFIGRATVIAFGSGNLPEAKRHAQRIENGSGETKQ